MLRWVMDRWADGDGDGDSNGVNNIDLAVTAAHSGGWLDEYKHVSYDELVQALQPG